jgi:hypothetical protein
MLAVDGAVGSCDPYEHPLNDGGQSHLSLPRKVLQDRPDVLQCHWSGAFSSAAHPAYIAIAIVAAAPSIPIPDAKSATHDMRECPEAC